MLISLVNTNQCWYVLLWLLLHFSKHPIITTWVYIYTPVTTSSNVFTVLATEFITSSNVGTINEESSLFIIFNCYWYYNILNRRKVLVILELQKSFICHIEICLICLLCVNIHKYKPHSSLLQAWILKSYNWKKILHVIMFIKNYKQFKCFYF